MEQTAAIIFQQVNKIKSLFPFLKEDGVDFLIENSTLQHYEKGSFFIQEGDEGLPLGFVTAGWFRQYKVFRKREVCTQFVFEAEFLTDFQTALNHGKSDSFIQAMEDAEVMILPNLAGAGSPGFHLLFRKLVEAQYLAARQNFEQMLFYKAEERYNLMLTNHLNWVRSVPLQYLASYLGMEKETLSRLRARQRKKAASSKKNRR
jgi:CRP/FNR family transcriptional regulator